MNRKSLLVLAAIAVVAAVLAIVGQRNDVGTGRTSDRVGNPAVPGLEDDLNSIDRVDIVTAGDSDAVTLQRVDDGWVVAQQDDYPADFSKLRTALVALGEASVVEEKTANPDFYDRLGVEPVDASDATGTEIRVSDGDRRIADVILGSESGKSGRFLRPADGTVSVLIDRNPDFPTDPTQWLVPDLVDVRADRIRRIRIEHADGEVLVISKPDRSATSFTVEGIPEGRELAYATVANVTGGALRELRLQAARKAVADAPLLATAEYQTFDGLVVTVTSVGSDDDPWIGIAARFDPSLVTPPATTAADSDSDDSAQTNDSGSAADAATADETAAAGDDTPNVQTEADDINGRLSGWQFRIPMHIYEQMTRRMSDLLKAPEDAEATEATPGN